MTSHQLSLRFSSRPHVLYEQPTENGENGLKNPLLFKRITDSTLTVNLATVIKVQRNIYKRAECFKTLSRALNSLRR